jgi:hypothetical protein
MILKVPRDIGFLINLFRVIAVSLQANAKVVFEYVAWPSPVSYFLFTFHGSVTDSFCTWFYQL